MKFFPLILLHICIILLQQGCNNPVLGLLQPCTMVVTVSITRLNTRLLQSCFKVVTTLNYNLVTTLLQGVPTGLLDWTTGLKIYPQNLVFCTVTTTKSYCQSSSKAVPIIWALGHLSCTVQPVYSGHPSVPNQLQPGCIREVA